MVPYENYIGISLIANPNQSSISEIMVCASIEKNTNFTSVNFIIKSSSFFVKSHIC